jgi:hypothetical protein
MSTHIAARAGRTAAGLAIMAILGLGGLIGAQNIIENPAKPLAKDGGRVLKLTEVWRITDEAGGFYFKYLHDLQIAEDGTIFLADSEQLLKFSQDGKFVKNLYKKGQGPGELGGDFYSYFTYGRDLFILDMNSRRFWRTDFDGVFQEQISLEKKDYGSFLGVLPDGFLFEKQAWPPPSERTGKLLEILHTVAVFARDGSWRQDVATFKPRNFLMLEGGMGWDSSITVPSPDAKLLYAYHGRDYLVEVIDLATGAVARRFNRAYSKVSHVESDQERDWRNKYGSPKREYETDANGLFPVGEGLWVETSANDKVRGRLIDVFDMEGRFVDSFYLGAGRSLMAVREDVVFCQEKSADDTIVIIKYRIEK